MLNWHRMVRPVAGLAQGDGEFDVYRMLFDICSRMDVRYEPAPSTPGRAPETDESPEDIASSYVRGEPRVGLFVDAPQHLSGVSATIGEWAAEARRRSLTLRVHVSADACAIPASVRFQPMGVLKLSSYAGLDLAVPGVAAVMDYVRRQAYDVIHVSTPGPMGLLGMLAARTFDIPLCGTFHTHFPQYARRLTGDAALEQAAWRYMRWFYGQMEHVAAPSASTLAELRERGFSPSMSVVGRGVDLARFSPGHRSDALRAQWGAKAHVLLYVGRISHEKNISVLASAFRMLAALRDDVALVMVGEGPAAAELQASLAGWPVHFLGTRTGAALAEAYASADCFVFPSETDTLGRVVLEAQASGLPVVVSGVGGPKDCVVAGRTGIVVDPMDPAALCHALDDLLRSGDMLQMSRDARHHARAWTHEASFNAFWRIHRALARMPSRSAAVT
jgi:glycosyltransferase involved in cell wall biosynthesis